MKQKMSDVAFQQQMHEIVSALSASEKFTAINRLCGYFLDETYLFVFSYVLHGGELENIRLIKLNTFLLSLETKYLMKIIDIILDRMSPDDLGEMGLPRLEKYFPEINALYYEQFIRSDLPSPCQDQELQLDSSSQSTQSVMFCTQMFQPPPFPKRAKTSEIEQNEVGNSKDTQQINMKRNP